MDKLTKDNIRNNIQWISKHSTGGQSVCLNSPTVTLKSEELDFEITIGWHRSQLRNKELALTLFNLALDELI